MLKSLSTKTGSIFLLGLLVLLFYSFSITESKKEPLISSLFFSTIVQQFNHQVKQGIKSEILSKDLPQRNYFVQDREVVQILKLLT